MNEIEFAAWVDATEGTIRRDQARWPYNYVTRHAPHGMSEHLRSIAEDELNRRLDGNPGVILGHFTCGACGR
jgi:hypothetical protein